MMFKSALTACGLIALFAANGAHSQTTDPSSLHNALRLTPVQESAWRTYRQALAPDPAAAARRNAARMLMANLPTPRRIDLINAEMAADQDSLLRQGVAVKTFYATLTPDQQRTFDQQTLPIASDRGDPND